MSRRTEDRYWVLRPSVTVVRRDEEVYEFFQTSTRRSRWIKVRNSLAKLIFALDGSRVLSELQENLSLNLDDVVTLIGGLHEWCIVETKDTREAINKSPWRRVLNLLGDYLPGDEILQAFNNVQVARVAIVGVGAVGSWTAIQLAHSGVENFILVDDDMVEVSNLTRSVFEPGNLGQLKAECIGERILRINPGATIEAIPARLKNRASCAKILNQVKADIVVNCADDPSVDETAEWIDAYCQRTRIPYVIAGGYNMHLSIVGMTVIPGETACVNCGRITLEDKNPQALSAVKRLYRKNRNLGSLSPLAGVTSSLCASEVFRLAVASRRIAPAMLNRRGEFNYLTNQLSFVDLPTRRRCGCVAA